MPSPAAEIANSIVHRSVNAMTMERVILCAPCVTKPKLVLFQAWPGGYLDAFLESMLEKTLPPPPPLLPGALPRPCTHSGRVAKGLHDASCPRDNSTPFMPPTRRRTTRLPCQAGGSPRVLGDEERMLDLESGDPAFLLDNGTS